MALEQGSVPDIGDRGDHLNAEPPLPRCFTLGLVVGKFAPLHLGHEWLVAQAARQCDRLLILSYTNPEFPRCEPTVRRRWLSTRFAGHETIVLDARWLQRRCTSLGISPRSFPENSSSDETQQEFLAWLLQTVLQFRPDAMFCSESYGVECASVLSVALGQKVTPVIVDLRRFQFPVRASQIRGNPHLHRDWIAPCARASFIRRIAIVGGESSGKTTLSAALAAHLETLWTREYGRELWERRSGKLRELDLLEIAREQIRREEAAAQLANRFLFCDTSPLTTAGYAEWMFGRVHPELAKLAKRSYDAVILCRPDFPFVQDGTRRDDAFRLEQHAWYQEQLRYLDCATLEAGGDIGERVLTAAKWISTLSLD